MSVVLAHTRATLVGYARYPAFAVPTLLLPTLFFVLFALPNHDVPHSTLTASFAAYAVFTVVFFQFGVGIAGERESAWETYLRSLPVTARARLAARVGAALVFAVVGCGLLVSTALATGYADLTPHEWARFVVALSLGSLPLALMGIALGYWVPPRGALPIANLVYLVFAYAGGLWSGPRPLPGVIRDISPFLPTRQWAEVLWPAVLDQPWRLRSWLALAAFALAFALLAAWGYRRDEGQRFR